MERAVFVIFLVALCLLAMFGLWAGWRRRAARQSHLAELPSTPTDLGPDLVEPVTGMYVSTTTSGAWQDRIVAQGLGRRANGAIRLSAEGVCIERDGERDIFVPVGDLRAVTTAPGVAGKVMGMANGVLIVRWSLGGVSVDSGFRSDDSAAQDHFIDAAIALIAKGQDGGRPADSPSTNGAPS
jgi:hypothetical protein